MGYIKEPKGIDFIVEPSVLQSDDLKAIHNAIAAYKKCNNKKIIKVISGGVKRKLTTPFKPQ